MGTVIKPIQAFTVRDTSTGELTSYAYGVPVEVTDATATAMIADGLVVAQNPVTPEGTLSVSANGTYDVASKAAVAVDVGILTVTYDANGGTGTVAAATVIAGNSMNLSDGTGLTAPSGKEFAGWATTDSAETADVESPYTPEDDITLYAVWDAE